jgi:hypothetical protein
MCVFARTLPWTSVLHVWDMFLCEGFSNFLNFFRSIIFVTNFSSILSKGIKIVFKVAIEIISTKLKDENKKTCPTMYETLQKLRNIPKNNLSESILVDHILKIELHDRDLQREHNVQEKNRRKAKIPTNNKNK